MRLSSSAITSTNCILCYRNYNTSRVKLDQQIYYWKKEKKNTYINKLRFVDDFLLISSNNDQLDITRMLQELQHFSNKVGSINPNKKKYDKNQIEIENQMKWREALLWSAAKLFSETMPEKEIVQYSFSYKR